MRTNIRKCRAGVEGTVLFLNHSLLRKCRAVLWKCRAVLWKCRAVLWKFRALLRKFRALLRKCRALLWRTGRLYIALCRANCG